MQPESTVTEKDFTNNYMLLIKSFKNQVEAAESLILSQAYISLLYNGKKFMSSDTANRLSKIDCVPFKAHELSPDLWQYHQDQLEAEA